jgi:hypothetical protein
MWTKWRLNWVIEYFQEPKFNSQHSKQTKQQKVKGGLLCFEYILSPQKLTLRFELWSLYGLMSFFLKLNYCWWEWIGYCKPVVIRNFLLLLYLLSCLLSSYVISLPTDPFVPLYSAMTLVSETKQKLLP